ncbi:malate dehydrogenase [Anaplasma marginale str. Gypsy Plains]|uniref:malate dehydrogenase n=1 Tax=Anaplasma marginale TaxID=770 RepID=UPI0003C33A2F|nr:malate dehydrogenase [Anaplasma marginale]AGZ78822.1 malate dehydrogenase [Anaplasma marginale str. Gypsy Plains]AXW84022.1 malate dehydrogenase [Anaplasma marginale]AXW84941.1 malate dehydrogenase [Anaplasma marginale]KAB0450911.1 malate dehydrogenase [Anaplasma marginale]
MRSSRSAKVSLVGAGNIGGALAHMLGASQVVRELVLVDVAGGMTEGKVLDVGQALALLGSDVSITGGSDYAAIEHSDAVVVTAGIPRKEGMSREDLLNTNAAVVRNIAENIAKYSPGALVIVVTNPLDAMVWCMYKYSGLPANRVVGMAGVLDSARFSFFLARHMNVSVSSVSAMVLGGHGDLMLPLLRYSTVGGVPVESLIESGRLNRGDIAAIVERTRKGGEEIVKLLKTGSAYCAPAASCAHMLESYVRDKRSIMPCSAYLDGQYGVRDLFVGVPVIIGEKGVEEVVEFPLTAEEQAVFDQSVELIRGSVSAIS